MTATDAATDRPVSSDGMPSQLFDAAPDERSSMFGCQRTFDAAWAFSDTLGHGRLAALGQVEPADVVEAAARHRIDDLTCFPVGVSAGGDS